MAENFSCWDAQFLLKNGDIDSRAHHYRFGESEISILDLKASSSGASLQTQNEVSYLFAKCVSLHFNIFKDSQKLELCSKNY